MGNDVFEPISQRSRRAEDAENRRIQEIADDSTDAAAYMKRNFEKAKTM